MRRLSGKSKALNSVCVPEPQVVVVVASTPSITLAKVGPGVWFLAKLLVHVNGSRYSMLHKLLFLATILG